MHAHTFVTWRVRRSLEKMHGGAHVTTSAYVALCGALSASAGIGHMPFLG